MDEHTFSTLQSMLLACQIIILSTTKEQQPLKCSYWLRVWLMSIEIGITRVLCGLLSLKRILDSRRLSHEEAHLIEHYRSLSETDRVAMRYLCTALKEISRF